MRVDRNDRIAGLPAPIAREVMRLFDAARPEHLLGYCVKDDDREFSEIAQALDSDGLLTHRKSGAQCHLRTQSRA
jgi:hypothetical protein